MLTDLRDLIELLRIKQWIKNLFIFAPLIFAQRLLDSDLLHKNALTVLAFCLLSSGVYILNDIYDLTADRMHPQKSTRPLTSGRFALPLARKIALALLIAGLFTGWAVNHSVLMLCFGYLILNLLYNVVTKKHIYLDVITIALGFQVRIWAGALAIGVIPSLWLQACTFGLTLFLGFTKRRHEISLVSTQEFGHRQVLAHYTVGLLDRIIIVCSLLSVIFYVLYTVQAPVPPGPRAHPLLYSTVFVVYGLLRYLYLIHFKKIGDDPGEIILTDKPVMICVLLWIGYIIMVLYGHRLFP